MQVYETTFILSPQADDAAFDRQINAITNLINKFNGKLLHEDRWGIRRLAYPIKKFNQGFYTRMIFEGNGALLEEIERHFKIEEPYLRYLTVIFEGDLERIKGGRQDEISDDRRDFRRGGRDDDDSDRGPRRRFNRDDDDSSSDRKPYRRFNRVDENRGSGSSNDKSDSDSGNA